VTVSFFVLFLAACGPPTDDTEVELDMIATSSKSVSVVKKCNIEAAEKGNEFVQTEVVTGCLGWLKANTALATVL